jgi:hypothetical protein
MCTEQQEKTSISTDELASLLNNLESSKFLSKLNKNLHLNLTTSKLVVKIREALAALVNSIEYQSWLDREPEFEGYSCPLPPTEEHQKLLQAVGIANTKAMLVKVNHHRGKYLLTDGLWVHQSIRTFAFTDESDALLSYIERNKIADWAGVIIDPCTGSGNHIVGFPGEPAVRIAFDISTRGILYTSINMLINGIDSGVVSYHNLTKGFPPLLNRVDLRNSLFIINTPFALAPVDVTLPKSADGGEDGLELTLAAMKLVKDVLTTQTIVNGRAIVLCYSIGNGKDKWKAVEEAKEMFGEDKVRWEILEDRKLWRVNGKKDESNPMLLSDGLPKKADCKFYIGNQDVERVRQDYVNLANRLSENAVELLGYEVTHLAYGIIDIRLN